MKSFNEFKIKKELVDKLISNGIKVPTEIQKEGIPEILLGKDIIGEAKTGSGKTLAFILPILNGLKNGGKVPQSIIITPTRELAIQIASEIEKLNNDEKIKVVLVYGGREISNNIEQLNNGVDIVVGTPGRLIDLIERKAIDLSKISSLVLDEVDQILTMGFKNEIETIIGVCNKKRQTLCFSATVTPQVKKIVYRITKEAKVISIKEEEDRFSHINQHLIKTTDRRKLNTLVKVLNETNPFMGIIFCRTKVRVDKLDEELTNLGFSCQKIHSDIPQVKREKIVKAFRNVEFQLLIATDVVGRGVDILGVTHVYNYDITEDVESYIHRIGRTGRNKEKGEAYLFVTERNEEMLKDIEKEMNLSIPILEVEYEEDIKSTIELPKKKYDKKINTRTKNIEEQKNRYRR